MKLTVTSVTIDTPYTTPLPDSAMRGRATLIDEASGISISVPIPADVIKPILELIEVSANLQLSEAR